MTIWLIGMTVQLAILCLNLALYLNYHSIFSILTVVFIVPFVIHSLCMAVKSG